MTEPDAFYEPLLASLPDGETASVQVGLFWTAVAVRVDGGLRCGLAATMSDTSHHYTNEPSIPDAGRLAELPARVLAALVRSPRLPEVSIGMAALNALLRHDPARWTDIHAEEVIARHGAGRTVVLVGHFPFVPHLEPRVGKLLVLEQEPRPGDLPASAAAQVIPQADVLAITAATLVNRTFGGLMALRRPDALTLLLGPTTPLSPILFESGVDILSGSIVEDIPAVLRGVSQGASFHQLHRMGVRLVSMTSGRLPVV